MKKFCNLSFFNMSMLRQFIATLAASFGMFVWGQSIGWSSVVNPQLRRSDIGLGLDDEGSSWVGSSLSIGGFVGGLMGGKIMRILGCKRSLLLISLISIGGWVLLATANHLITIAIGRFICGWVAACNSIIEHVYIAEVTSSHYRGLFGSFMSLCLAFGITYVIVVGAFVESWQLTTVACIVPVVIGFVILLFVPESPYFLMSKYNDEKGARKSLSWFYYGNIEQIEQAMTEIREYQKKVIQIDEKKTTTSKSGEKSEPEPQNEKKMLEKAEENVPTKNKIKDCIKSIDWLSVRLIFVMSVVMILSRLTGISPLSYYLVEIFQHSSKTFDPFWSAIIVSILEIFGMIVSLAVTDKAGRKVLLIISGIGSAICLCILAWSFDVLLASEGDEVSTFMRFLPLISMLAFYFIFSVGYGVTPLIILGELFPDKTKALASSISMSIFWLFDFAVAKVYFLLTNLIGVGGNFYLLGGCTFLGVIFVIFFVPETKDKTLAEIQTMVEKNKVFLNCDISSSCKKNQQPSEA